MGREIACNRNEDVSALVSPAPRGELADSRLQHLVSMEASIFAQHRMRDRSNQRLWRMAEREVLCDQPCREIDLSLPVEGVEQGGADRLRIGGQIVELPTALVRNPGRRHIEIACKVKRHCSVQYAARDRNMTISVGS